MNLKEFVDVSLLNLNLICRTCLKETHKGDYIFDIETKTQMSLAEMLKTFTTSKIQLGDELPQKICIDCRNLIISAYNFKILSEHNEKLLYDYLLNRKNSKTSFSFEVSEHNRNSEGIHNDSKTSICKNSEPTMKISIKEEILDETEDTKDNITKLENNLIEFENIKRVQSVRRLKGSNRKCKKKDIENIVIKKHEFNENLNNEKTCEEAANENTEIDENLKIKDVIEQNVNFLNEISIPFFGKKKTKIRKNPIEPKTYAYDEIVCKVCKKEFAKPFLLRRHMDKHDANNKKYECTICHKSYTQRDNMKTHMKKFHDESYVPKPITNDGKQLCTYCGKRVSHIIVHLRRHTGERPFKCDICDRAFPSLPDVKQHKLIHTGEKRFSCTVCGKAFAKSNKLKCHQRIHTGERPYKCTYCEQAFFSTNDLKHHVRRHTGEKPHECGDCGKRFIQKTALRTHCKSQGHNIDNCKNYEIIKESLLIRPLDLAKID